MNHEMDIQKYEGWLIQLCKEQRPLDDIAARMEQVSAAPQETYLIHLERRENGIIANSRTVTFTRDDIDDMSAGQTLLRAISEV